ncbi:MAG: hypothetical protein HC933_05005 [Pleurocapsa sp. SU_196_0]|nr:hypothetical protein [Pleurocapsa sp. SU_196_0]
MTVPAANGEINLGSSFSVSVTGAKGFDDIARELGRTFNEAQKAGFELEGNWRGAIAFFATMRPRLDLSVARANRTVAVMYHADVQSAWEAQSLAGTWTPLNAKYAAEKISDGLGSRTLIATRAALESLGYTFSDDLSISIGVTVTSEGSDEPYMLVQEFGSNDGSVPARALFGPILDQNLSRYVRVYEEAVEKALEGGVYPDFTQGAFA